MRPRLLDLFCGAGGAAMGYHHAGFDVVGVDIKPQPRYPFEFVQADAMTYPLDGFDAVHASPPCQDHSTLSFMGEKHGTGWMLAATLERLTAQNRPWAVENVPGASAAGAYVLCGKAFGLAPLKRHRLFWTSVPMLVPQCTCNPRRDHTVGVYGELSISDRIHSRTRRTMRAGVETARRLMGCPWMTGPELSQTIPPVYTEHVGGYLLAAMAPPAPAWTRCGCGGWMQAGNAHYCGGAS